MMKKLFGTDGIRQEFGKGFFSGDNCARIGSAAGVFLKTSFSSPTVLIGRDTRASSEEIERMLSSGLAESGVKSVSAGVIPTPAVARLVKKNKFAAGIVISASHNPWRDNGIKFFAADAEKLSDAAESEIEKIYAAAPAPLPRKSADAAPYDPSLLEEYLRFIADAASCRLDGIKIAVDCANGAAYRAAPEALAALGAEVTAINVSPDGRNINENCGSLHPGVCAGIVVRIGADCGVSFDGDADRAIFSDENGAAVDGDRIMGICAVAMKREGKLPGDKVVATVMSNIGFMKAMSAAGISVATCAVGDKNVWEEMKKTGAALGGEQSGHIIFRDFASTGDGILTAVRLLCTLKKSGRKLSELASAVPVYPQKIINVRVAEKIPFEKIRGFSDALAAEEKKLADKGRIFVRYSGTEPLLRIMVEGPDEKSVDDAAARLKEVYLKSVI